MQNTQKNINNGQEPERELEKMYTSRAPPNQENPVDSLVLGYRDSIEHLLKIEMYEYTLQELHDAARMKVPEVELHALAEKAINTVLDGGGEDNYLSYPSLEHGHPTLQKYVEYDGGGHIRVDGRMRFKHDLIKKIPLPEGMLRRIVADRQLAIFEKIKAHLSRNNSASVWHGDQELHTLMWHSCVLQHQIPLEDSDTTDCKNW